MEELHGLYIEDMEEGMTGVYAKTITDADVVLFAGISGDVNPVHLNHEFAAESMFEGRIAHGMLSASFLSTIFGTRLPGPGCIYMSQTLRFKAPVRVGDTVIARVKAKAVDMAKRRVTFDCECKVGDTTVIEGEALIMVPSKKKKSAK